MQDYLKDVRKKLYFLIQFVFLSVSIEIQIRRTTCDSPSEKRSMYLINPL